MPSDEIPREPTASDRKPTGGQSPRRPRLSHAQRRASAGAEDLQDLQHAGRGRGTSDPSVQGQRVRVFSSFAGPGVSTSHPCPAVRRSGSDTRNSVDWAQKGSRPGTLDHLELGSLTLLCGEVGELGLDPQGMACVQVHCVQSSAISF